MDGETDRVEMIRGLKAGSGQGQRETHQSIGTGADRVDARVSGSPPSRRGGHCGEERPILPSHPICRLVNPAM